MKTIIIVALLCAASLASYCQSYTTGVDAYGNPVVTEVDSKTLKPYASVGAGVSGNFNTYAAEVGLYNHSYWVSVVAEFTPDQGSTQVYMGPKFYKTLCDVTKESQLLAYGALKLHLNHVRDFAFEPGICYVYSFCDKFALQISASTPIYEGQALGKPTNLSGGLGINWWIR